MSLRHVLDVCELLDGPDADGAGVRQWLASWGADQVDVTRVSGVHGSTDFVRCTIPGSAGKLAGGSAPTLGVVGRLGGVGGRPERIGLVSDADGALITLATAAKLADMRRRGDHVAGDIELSTHVCPEAPILPHDPVPFMSAPVDMATMNEHEVGSAADAVLSVDATKGNRLVNHCGLAVSPPVRQGWILRCSADMLDIAERVTGLAAVVLPLSTQDITPYGNGVHHVNSIVQPATATDAPVVGLAVTAESVVAGSATGASDPRSLEQAVRFSVEVATTFGPGDCEFHSATEFERLVQLYGSMAHVCGR